MSSYYKEVKEYIEYCADIQHFIDGVLVEIGVALDEETSVCLSEVDGSIRFYDGEKVLMLLEPGSRLTEMLNDVFVEIQDLTS